MNNLVDEVHIHIHMNTYVQPSITREHNDKHEKPQYARLGWYLGVDRL